jgi:hypothetical protein
MTPLEYNIVCGVFGSTLPDRTRIAITDAAGLSGRPFTIPAARLEQVGMGSLPPAAGGVPNGVLRTGYVINAGKYHSSLGSKYQNLLVHETTHVWQGHSSVLPVSYVFGSLVAQALHGSGAYQYTRGQAWKSYNPEQQAMIVEDWFRAGQSTTDPRYQYIVNHLRKGDC